MESKNIKETIKLLDRPSDSESDLSDLIFPAPKKKKVKRRPPRSSKIKHSPNSCSCNRSKSRLISLWLAAVLITFWLVALSWLAAILYGEIGKMDVNIRSAINFQCLIKKHIPYTVNIIKVDYPLELINYEKN